MITASPLRYPGGKSSMADLLRQIRKLNKLGNRPIAEPFAGGAGASLTLLFEEEAPGIYINDLDPAIRDFWWSVTKRCDELVQLIRKTRVGMREWQRQRELFRSTRRISRINRGFAAFYLNRCNRSGIIFNGGPIGGVEQSGRWKINARFNKRSLIARCQRIADFGDRVVISGMDGIDLLESLDRDKVFFFIDPPYFEKGQSLYLNDADYDYHKRLAQKLRGMKRCAWVLTYDNCPEIDALYRDWANVRPFSLRYSASERRKGREVLITPKWLRLPETQSSASIAW